MTIDHNRRDEQRGQGEQDSKATDQRKPARGVRWEPEEYAWLAWLEGRMFDGIPGARRSFSAAVREAVTCGRWLLGDASAASPPIDALRRLAARLNVTPEEALRRAIEAYGQAVVAQPRQPESTEVDGGGSSATR